MYENKWNCQMLIEPKKEKSYNFIPLMFCAILNTEQVRATGAILTCAFFVQSYARGSDHCMRDIKSLCSFLLLLNLLNIQYFVRILLYDPESSTMISHKTVE